MHAFLQASVRGVSPGATDVSDTPSKCAGHGHEGIRLTIPSHPDGFFFRVSVTESKALKVTKLAQPALTAWQECGRYDGLSAVRVAPSHPSAGLHLGPAICGAGRLQSGA